MFLLGFAGSVHVPTETQGHPGSNDAVSSVSTGFMLLCQTDLVQSVRLEAFHRGFDLDPQRTGVGHGG